MSVKTLIVAGGGAGGTGEQYPGNGGVGGGGGAGGYIYNPSLSLTALSYPIIVGNGGGSNGQDSSFNALVAIGGGRGGAFAGLGVNGGSGGGGGSSYQFPSYFPDNAGGTATAGQGSNGGNGHQDTSGSGGGAGAAGTTNGVGAVGILNPLTSSGFICGGGGVPNKAGGNGGGGAGAVSNADGTNGTANTGGGGGAATSGSAIHPVSTPGQGGSGLVQVAYHTDGSDGILPTSTGGTITTLGSLTLHTFNSSGTFTPVYTPLYWVGGTGTWDSSTATHWALTSGGAGGTVAPTVNTPVIVDSNSGVGTITFTTGVAYSLNFTGYTGTFAGSAALSLAGDLTLGSGMTISYTGAVTFAGVTQTLTSNGKTLLSNLINTGILTFADASIALRMNNSGTLNLGSNLITFSGGNVSMWVNTGTINAGTSTIKMIGASFQPVNFTGGGSTYNNLWLTGSGTGEFLIAGSNTFADFKCDTPPHSIRFDAGTTTSISTFTVNGTAGNLMTLHSSSAGTPWKITKNTSGFVSCDYLSIQDSLVI